MAETVTTQDNISVFISYARPNTKFIEGVMLPLLEKRGYDVWIDKEGLLPGEQFNNEIEAGIRDSDIFLFVYEHDALASPYCNRELAFAQTLNKRIIPFRHRMVEESQLDEIRTARNDWKGDEALVDSNYAFLSLTQNVPYFDDIRNEYRTTNTATLVDVAKDVEKHYPNVIASHENQAIADSILSILKTHLETLLRAIETDPEHLREHTRILRSIEQWEQNGQSENYLITNAARLDEVLKWQREAANKAPAITEQMIDYLQRSQTYQLTRQRRTTRRITAAAVIFLIVAIVAGVAAEVARRQTIRADAEAVRANNEADRANVEAQEAILQRNIAQDTNQNFAIDVASMNVEIGGRPSDVLLFDNTLWVTNVESGELWRIRPDIGTVIGDPIDVGEAPTAPITDGQYVWVANPTTNQVHGIDPENPDNVLIFDTGSTPQTPVGLEGVAWVLAEDELTQIRDGSVNLRIPLSGGGKSIAAYDENYLWVLDDFRRTLFRVGFFAGDTEEIRTERSPQGITLAGGSAWLTHQGIDTLVAIDSVPDTTLTEIPVSGRPSQPIAANGRLWFADYINQLVIEFDPTTRAIVNQYPINENINRLYVYGERLYVTTATSLLLTFDINTTTLLNTIDLVGTFHDPIADTEHLWFINPQADTILLVDSDTGLLERSLLPSCTNPGRGLFDGASVWLPCGEDNLVRQIPALMSFSEFTQFERVARSQEPFIAGGFMWILQLSDTASSLAQINLDTGDVLDSFDVSPEAQDPVYDGTYIWVAGKEYVTRINPQNTDEVHNLLLRGALFASDPVPIGEYVWVTTLQNMTATGDIPNIYIFNRESLERFELNYGNYASPAVYDEQYDVVWVAGGTLESGYAYRFNPTTFELLSQTSLGFGAFSAEFLDDSVWYTSVFATEALMDVYSAALTGELPGLLSHLNRADGALLNEIDLDELPSNPVFSDDHLWITQVGIGPIGMIQVPIDDASVLAFNLETLEIEKTWRLCESVNSATYDDETGYIWFMCITDEIGTVFVIDTRTENLDIVAQFDGLGTGSWPAKRIGDEMWVAHQSSGNVTVFDAYTAHVITQYGVGGSPTRPVFDGEYYWVSNAGDGTVQRIIYPPPLQVAIGVN